MEREEKNDSESGENLHKARKALFYIINFHKIQCRVWSDSMPTEAVAEMFSEFPKLSKDFSFQQGGGS